MKYKSEIFAAIHETMQGLHDIGVIDKKQCAILTNHA